MVQAIINIDDRANRILNIIKAKYGLKDKSQAINLMAEQYEVDVMEPELRPEYVEKMAKRQKEPTVAVKDFRKHFGLKPEDTTTTPEKSPHRQKLRPNILNRPQKKNNNNRRLRTPRQNIQKIDTTQSFLAPSSQY